MPVENSCLIGTLGLLEHEISLMQSIFKISNNRDHVRYELLHTNLDEAHIILATIDNEAAMEKWQQLANNGRSPILLAITPKALGKFPGYSFSRPFSPTKVLSVLDEICKADLSQFFKAPQAVAVKTSPAEIITPQSSNAPHHTQRALVIDDSPIIRNHIERELTLYHLHVDSAETGEQGLELFEAKDYDIVFLDVVMPGIDGYQVCKTIRRNPEKKHIPVVMLTSKSSPFDKVRGSISGCSSYLTKPLDEEKFYQILVKYILHAKEE
jgi:twitching motility two-component system response regulator PilG